MSKNEIDVLSGGNKGPIDGDNKGGVRNVNIKNLQEMNRISELNRMNTTELINFACGLVAKSIYINSGFESDEYRNLRIHASKFTREKDVEFIMLRLAIRILAKILEDQKAYQDLIKLVSNSDFSLNLEETILKMINFSLDSKQFMESLYE